jgi:Flp pilus assembly protein TadG
VRASGLRRLAQAFKHLHRPNLQSNSINSKEHVRDFLSGYSRERNGERGAAAVEFALIVSLLLLIVFGIVAFGSVYSELEVMESAAREGARAAAVRTPDQIVAAVNDAAAPYSVDNTPTANIVCDDATVGERVTVSWSQDFEVELVLAPPMTFTRQMRGVFRCE